MHFSAKSEVGEETRKIALVGFSCYREIAGKLRRNGKLVIFKKFLWKSLIVEFAITDGHLLAGNFASVGAR